MSISNGYFTAVETAPGILRINSEENAAVDLILGSERAALIDTGFGVWNIRDLVRTITDFPLLIFNTHCHCDHVGGNYFFDEEIRMGTADLGTRTYAVSRFFRDSMLNGRTLPESFDKEAYYSGGCGNLIPVEEGESFGLGGLTVEALSVPGHSVGSMAYYVPERKIVFVGDSVGRTVLLYGNGSADRPTYVNSLKKILALPFVTAMASHEREPLGRDYIERCLRTAELADYESGTPVSSPIAGSENARLCFLPGMTEADQDDPEFGAIIMDKP